MLLKYLLFVKTNLLILEDLERYFRWIYLLFLGDGVVIGVFDLVVFLVSVCFSGGGVIVLYQMN